MTFRGIALVHPWNSMEFDGGKDQVRIKDLSVDMMPPHGCTWIYP